MPPAATPLSDLAAADYRVSVTAAGFVVKTATVTLAAGSRQSLDLALTAAATTAPSLNDLGFTPEQTRGSAAEQARLDRRTHMLKTHQRLGLITIAPLVATLISANGAAEKRGGASGRELHAALGSVTAGLYLTTASFAIFAPKVPETSVRGPIRLHRALAWVHGPGMILTPILGALAYQQRSRGGKGPRHCPGARSDRHCHQRRLRPGDSLRLHQVLSGTMQTSILAVLLLAAPVALLPADSQWVLEDSTLSYHVSHPLHQIDGVSHAARGKGGLPCRAVRLPGRRPGQGPSIRVTATATCI